VSLIYEGYYSRFTAMTEQPTPYHAVLFATALPKVNTEQQLYKG